MLFRDDAPNALYFRRGVEPKPSSIHGVGMFATEDLSIHYCIEVSPIILFSKSLLNHHFDLFEDRHILHDYVFRWNDGRVGIGLGYSSIYNHHPEPNAMWRLREGDWPGLEFFTQKEIKAGEEIYTRYRPDSQELPFLDEKEAARINIKL